MILNFKKFEKPRAASCFKSRKNGRSYGIAEELI